MVYTSITIFALLHHLHERKTTIITSQDISSSDMDPGCKKTARHKYAETETVILESPKEQQMDTRTTYKTPEPANTARLCITNHH
jgi:hypothetical protein